LSCRRRSLEAGELGRAGRVGGQPEDKVGGDGARFGTRIATGIETEPYETSYAAEADLFGTKSGGVTGGNAAHFGEVVHGAEFHLAGTGKLAHGVEFSGDTSAPGNAGLRAAIENFFDGAKSRVVDAFSEGEVEGVGRGNVVERQHLKGFEDGKRNAARRVDGGKVERGGNGTSPLQSEGGSDFLFGGKAKFLDPLTDFSVTKQRLGPADARGRAPDRVVLERWWT